MDYREECEWTLRFEASAEFDEDYDGELDGYAWRELFYKEVAPRVLRAAFRELQSVKGWKVRPANRGRSSEDEVLIKVELDEAARTISSS